jgi:hypothetical protein
MLHNSIPWKLQQCHSHIEGWHLTDSFLNLKIFLLMLHQVHFSSEYKCSINTAAFLFLLWRRYVAFMLKQQQELNFCFTEWNYLLGRSSRGVKKKERISQYCISFSHNFTIKSSHIYSCLFHQTDTTTDISVCYLKQYSWYNVDVWSCLILQYMKFYHVHNYAKISMIVFVINVYIISDQ